MVKTSKAEKQKRKRKKTPALTKGENESSSKQDGIWADTFSECSRWSAHPRTKRKEKKKKETSQKTITTCDHTFLARHNLLSFPPFSFFFLLCFKRDQKVYVRTNINSPPFSVYCFFFLLLRGRWGYGTRNVLCVTFTTYIFLNKYINIPVYVHL